MTSEARKRLDAKITWKQGPRVMWSMINPGRVSADTKLPSSSQSYLIMRITTDRAEI